MEHLKTLSVSLKRVIYCIYCVIKRGIPFEFEVKLIEPLQNKYQGQKK